MAHTNSSTIRIRRGLNLPLTGQPEQAITAGDRVRSVALLGDNFSGLKPRVLVEQGQKVLVGQPLFVDKRDPDVLYTAPASGTVTMINRGARRALQSVVIECDADQPACEDYRSLAETDLGAMSAADVALPIYKSGLWPAFRMRPYNKVPQSDAQPDAIFVTAIDTQPLAADPAVVVREHAEAFTCGMRALARLTSGNVHLCTGADWSGPVVEEAQHTEFIGPHPAGLAGTHIHFLYPVGAERSVWHIGYQDVIAIGKLFGAGELWTDRIIALGGQGFARPRLVTTQLGASISDLTAGEVDQKATVRLVSGSVLNGHAAEGSSAWLGRYHTQVTALPERGKRKLFGWLRSGGYSFAGRLSSREAAPTGQSLTTAQHGRLTAMLPVDAFDKVMPLDMLPAPLLKALLIKDTDQAQALGCLELAPDDLALCTFVCPGKNDYGAVLVENLKQIERDG